jgi:hypothetical protein
MAERMRCLTKKCLTKAALGFVMLVGLSACSPKIVDRWHTQYVVQNVHHRDTVITKDSVYIREWMNGDTVYIEKYKDRYVYRDRWRDSIFVKEVHDTTAVEVKVEKDLSWAQRAKINSFPWLLLALISLGGILYLKRK